MLTLWRFLDPRTRGTMCSLPTQIPKSICFPYLWYGIMFLTWGASTPRVLLDSHSACLDLRLGCRIAFRRIHSNLSNIIEPHQIHMFWPLTSMTIFLKFYEDDRHSLRFLLLLFVLLLRWQLDVLFGIMYFITGILITGGRVEQWRLSSLSLSSR